MLQCLSQSLFLRIERVNPAGQHHGLSRVCMPPVGYHVSAMAIPSALDDEINLIFCPRLLFWLEVVSVLRQVWRGAKILFIATRAVRDIRNQSFHGPHACLKVRLPALSQFLRDASTFVLSFFEVIELNHRWCR